MSTKEHLVFISHSSADKIIADAMCHHLENEGIRCWIAPRDINTTDWAGSIMDGLRRSDVFVVIITHNSIASGEVTKEVTEATHTCDYILPFKVEKDELSDRLRYHLGPCHWLDAVLPPMEERFAELTERIKNLSGEDAVYMNQNCWKLSDKIVWPRGLFIGREEEMQEIADHLESDHILFLQGMGGIGKSEIAKGYAKMYRDRYDTVIFASYTADLMTLVSGDELPIDNLRKAEDESQEDFFKRKLKTFKDLATERTLLIIDNFDVDDDKYLDDVVNGPYKLLITTRNEHCDYPTMQVGKIRDFDKVRQIFTTNYGRALPAKEMEIVDEILKLVGCHTITVELIAKQMKASFLKPAKMLELLKSTGTNTKLKEKIKREGSHVSLTSFDYIRQLFQLSGLKEEEKHLLCCMCMIPYFGIEVPFLGEILKMEDYDVINELLSKSWLMMDDESDKLMLHPVICDVVKEQLSPTPLSCLDYIMGLWEKSRRCWYYTVEERNTFAPYVAYIQNSYPQPVKELCRQYGDFVNIAWMCGDFERSQRAGHTYYEFCLKEYGPGSTEAGNAATWLAGAYHNGGDDASAEPYYKIGLEHRLGCAEPNHHSIGTSYSKLGRCAYKKHEFEASKEYLDKAMAEFQILYDAATDDAGRKEARWYSGDTVVEIERLHMEMGEFEKALPYCHESYEIFYQRENKEISNNVYSLVDLGMCHSALGNYEEAEHYLNRALDLNITLNGIVSLQTMRTREAIADNLLRQGKTEDARRAYLEIELDLERDYGPENPQVHMLREKREKIEL